ncbi:oligopeptide/dipeptide ABC transporter ATP-binding protein [Demequina mangrovi]|uniref:Peptide/nickel transport system ATP-binding protein/oligopeptide transport system ATP-binding protein n=1 Tax=Demequina mangrovi TaxID=1043493 RepID=A0A1H7B342_9MICO|nr:ABC transporter ATP-binding protein [Demequina mangrovi]SEJ71334.1 peptide/nickel transport system ATP-binding protein/oligopeptide transport system ATP-binding protein [Demequina mangrovi]
MTEVTTPADEAPVLEVNDLEVRFTSGRSTVYAVNDVSFTMRAGETLALVGESGSGKSTIAKAVVGLVEPASGEVLLRGEAQAGDRVRRDRATRGDIQMVFQNPVGSLNPFMTVEANIAEPLRNRGVAKAERAARVRELLTVVGLDADTLGPRKPGEISGGQAQRVSIARALASEPAVLIADEAVSALDVSVQATVLNVLRRVVDEEQVAMLFISHDLAVVRNVSDTVAVLHMGQLCEIGPTEDILAAPAHHYTAALRAAVPEPGVPLGDPGMTDADPPSPRIRPTGCSFRDRCLAATSRCAEVLPPLTMVGPERAVACHHPLDRDAVASAIPSVTAQGALA